MKKKRIEAIPVPTLQTKSQKQIGKATKEGEYLILDIFREQNHTGRYIINIETGEHASRTPDGEWSKKKLIRMLGFDPLYDSIYSDNVKESILLDTKEDEETMQILAKGKNRWIQEIAELERDYDGEMRIRTKENRYRKVDRMMSEVPEVNEEFREWIYGMCKERFLFYNKETKAYGCSCCGTQIPEQDLERKPKHGETMQCPHCGTQAVVKKRQKQMWKIIRVCKLERICPEYGMARHFKAEIEQTGTGHRVYLDEGVRIKLHRKDCDPRGYEIYYNQDDRIQEWWTGLTRSQWWITNPRNKRMGLCFLYPDGIREALEGTGYEIMINAFLEMAGCNLEADYNAAMAAGYRYQRFAYVLEYLIKGRFYRMCQEATRRCEAYNGSYYGILNLRGEDIGQVMGIEDRQKIFRIREEDMGEAGVIWMRYSEEYHQKVSRKSLEYLEKHRVTPDDIVGLPGDIAKKMSLEKIIHYLEAQIGEHYRNVPEVLNQWGDYLAMCQAVGKSLDEEMFYKPKDLKRRHDELVTDKQKLEIVKRMAADPQMRELEAKNMEEKFPKATEVMKEIKGKYEFAAAGFRMILPETPIEIVKEGYALHHCAGSSDRYFNRIENRETFIGFLRREEEPDIPFYTVEFEPGGTIRQNRSYYDEEPGIGEIRGFLKLWQKEIKKRMTMEDREAAKRSAILREENIRQLQEDRNTFVLNKLMEDFMEAV